MSRVRISSSARHPRPPAQPGVSCISAPVRVRPPARTTRCGSAACRSCDAVVTGETVDDSRDCCGECDSPRPRTDRPSPCLAAPRPAAAGSPSARSHWSCWAPRSCPTATRRRPSRPPPRPGRRSPTPPRARGRHPCHAAGDRRGPRRGPYGGAHDRRRPPPAGGPGPQPGALRRLRGPALLPQRRLDRLHRGRGGHRAGAERDLRERANGVPRGDRRPVADRPAPPARRPRPGRPREGRPRRAHRGRPVGGQGVAAAPPGPGRRPAGRVPGPAPGDPHPDRVGHHHRRDHGILGQHVHDPCRGSRSPTTRPAPGSSATTRSPSRPAPTGAVRRRCR